MCPIIIIVYVSVNKTICNLPNIIAELGAVLYVSTQTERIHSRTFEL